MRTRKFTIIVLCAHVFMSSCGITKQHERKKAPTPNPIAHAPAQEHTLRMITKEQARAELNKAIDSGDERRINIKPSIVVMNEGSMNGTIF